MLAAAAAAVEVAEVMLAVTWLVVGVYLAAVQWRLMW